MIQQIKDLPPQVLGLRASGRVSELDYHDIIFPLFAEYSNRVVKLKYVMLLETEINNFTLGAWLNDAALGLKYFSKWEKVAIVTDQKGVRMFTNIFGKMVPGEYRGYPISKFASAIEWMLEPT